MDDLALDNENPGPILWKKDQRELAVWLADAFKRGAIEATSERQALILMAPHFTIADKDGDKRIVDGRSLWENYRQKKEKDNGNPSR